MGKREILFFLTAALAISTLLACEKNVKTDNFNNEEVENIKDHEYSTDYIWSDFEVVDIALNENSIATD
jgi:predicted  nucleic acid-binding Zn ribbon protein